MAGKYEYRFVRVKVGGGFFGGLSTDYQQVIEQHARNGWRFVQAYAPATAGYGRSVLCDLIFERESE
ncbi:MAG: DUF4177 domain-containing protein [Candidatus Hydrogenedentes bacterium]|nr:DUF4177 domain-containing protein [Candidatus Hydrogenedentota bacterium]